MRMTEKKSTQGLSLPIIFRKSLGQDAWVQGSIQDVKGGLEVQSFIHARKKGDEGMKAVEAEIQRQANKLKLPITHKVYATNKGSRALLQRISGYTHIGIDEGEEVYKKIFKPL